MPALTATALRLEIEHALERSFPAALSPVIRTLYEYLPTGVAEIDALLDGGLPMGAISEVTGPESSGRTSLVLSFLAQRTVAGQVCAWVDAEDAFDPESAAANGVKLGQLLWVRCQNTDRQPRSSQESKPWSRLDQGLRATDLLLQAGGFAAIVLDLGDTAAQYARRIPLATWFRFRQSADRARTCLVVLAQASCAQSSAAAVLECAPLRPVTASGTVLRGFNYAVRRERQRTRTFVTGQRKPPASTWQASGSWDVEQSA